MRSCTNAWLNRLRPENHALDYAYNVTLHLDDATACVCAAVTDDVMCGLLELAARDFRQLPHDQQKVQLERLLGRQALFTLTRGQAGVMPTVEASCQPNLARLCLALAAAYARDTGRQ